MRHKIASIFVFVGTRNRGLLESAGWRASRDLRYHRDDAVTDSRTHSGEGHRHPVGRPVDSGPVQHEHHARSDSESARRSVHLRRPDDDGAAGEPRPVEPDPDVVHSDEPHRNHREPRSSRLRLRQRDHVPDRRRFRRDRLLAFRDPDRGCDGRSRRRHRRRRGPGRLEHPHGHGRRRRRRRQRVPAG